MKEITVNTKFTRPNGTATIEVVSVDAERKTAMVKAQDGKTWALSFATLHDKRSWVELVEDEVQTVEVEPVVDGQPKEEHKKVEKKATKKVTKKTTSTAKFHDFNFDLKYYLEVNDFEVKTWEKVKSVLSVSKDGKRLSEIRIRKTKVHVYTKVANENSVELEKADCGFKFRTTFEYGESEQKLMETIKNILA